MYAAPGSNAINTVDALVKLFEDRSRSFPAGMEYNLTLDTTLAVRASIEEIEHTLVEALLLVVLVVFVFLQGWRATLIPAIAVPVSIIATFALFPLLGFTLNTICLMGMVLAIGLVVDDAIVVVEAVESHMERGLTPRQAAFAAMEEVSGPVIAIALVLAAVFLPSLLLPGITGTLFQQFAVTIAISMLISAFNALTLSPALSAILLKPKDPTKGGPLKFFYRVFNRSYDATANGYTKVCHFLTRKLIISIPLLALIAYAIVPVAKKIPNGFLPDEDQGYLFAALIMPEARSLQLTTAAADKVSELIRQNPNVKDVIAISGFSLLTGRAEHEQRLLLRHAQALGGTPQSGPERPGGHRPAERPADHESFRRHHHVLPASGHCGGRFRQRRHLHAGRPRRQGHGIPGGTNGHLCEGSEQASDIRPEQQRRRAQRDVLRRGTERCAAG